MDMAHALDLVSRAREEQALEYASDFEVLNGALEVLIDEVEPDLKVVIGRQLLSSTEVQDRVLATRLLRETWEERSPALQLVTAALTAERDADVIGWLLAAVALLGDASSLDAVEPFVKHADSRVRDQAVGAIARSGADTGAPSAREALLDLSCDLSEEVRFSAIYELGQWWTVHANDRRIEARLREALEDHDLRIARVATDALSPTAHE